MGAVLQTAGAAELLAELTCCACSTVCGLVTRDSATRAKFRYCSFLLIATVTCIILLIPGLRYKLDKIPNFCSKTVSSDTCDKFVGFSAVYRILISLAVFHFVLALLTIKVTRVKSFRARFNNGLWFFKMGLIFGLTLLTFAIPKKTEFFRIWMYVSITAAFVFIMFQIILIIDFGHSWSLSWAEKLEGGYTRLWYAAMALVTLFMFALSCVALFTFYAYFTHAPKIQKCHANVFYISFVGLQCVLAAFISVTPSVQQELAGSGLLQSSVVILYTIYLTWNTLSSEPDPICNPLGGIILEYDSLTGVSGESIFGCVITLILLLFACTVRANTSHLGKYGLALAESEAFAMETYKEDRSKANVEKRLESGEKQISLGEYVGYNYSFFHIIMSIASLYILMVLTNWHSPEESSDLRRLVKNWASVWVQMASSFVCILIYIWFLVTPLIKKVWGPTFGVIVEDNDYFSKGNYKYEKVEQYEDPKNPFSPVNQKPPSHSKNQNSTVSIEKGKLDLTPENIEKHERTVQSKNTFNPNVSISTKPKLKRRNSIESIYSATSFCSNVTSMSKKSKRKSKFINVNRNSDFLEKEIAQRGSSVISSKNDAKIKQRSRQVEEESENESMFSYNSVRKKTSQISKKTNNYEPSHDKKIGISDQVYLDERDENNKQRRVSHEKIYNNVNNKQSFHEEIDFNEEPSDVPAVFKNKEQDPDTAREILKLQWNILRTQAKVVKVQERIMKLQERNLMMNSRISNVPPACQSSVIDYSNKQKLRFNKEPG